MGIMRPRTIRLVIRHAVLLLAAQVTAGAALAASCGLADRIDGFQSGNDGPEGAVCTTYLGLSGGSGVSCHWEFAFRGAAAQHHADELWSTLTRCRSGVVLGPDIRVNHPDSYDLRELNAGEVTYRVSLKDKAALNRTLVFLRLDANSAPQGNQSKTGSE
ncbi:MAG: hypothetical protein AAGD47_09775 [Pseudomonadota bacterium]